MQKSGARLGYDGRQVAAPAGAAALPDGTYNVAVRPHHLMLRAPDGEAMAVEAAVATTEITGSESFVHLAHGGLRWVALADRKGVVGGKGGYVRVGSGGSPVL